jgi:hypothetical protein
MPKDAKKHDDPFDDEDWGPSGETMPDSDTMPEPSAETKPPFIKPHHVGKAVMGTMKLLRVTSEVTEYSDVVLLVEYRGKQFRLGLKLYSDDYKKLKERFGPKKEKWSGELRYKVMPHGGREAGYIAVR